MPKLQMLVSVLVRYGCPVWSTEAPTMNTLMLLARGRLQGGAQWAAAQEVRHHRCWEGGCSFQNDSTHSLPTEAKHPY